MKRGEVWWASLPMPHGSEPGYRRPILVVQNDHFNRSNINTVLGVVVTSNLALAAAPGNVLLRGQISGLHRDSLVNVSQIITVDRRFLTENVGTVDKQTMQRIDDGLRMVLAL
jgi:mRNA interferase MazF